MPVVPISSIKVEDRQREDYGDLPDLASSLADQRYGQLQPILINRDSRLVAGGRRLAAAALLASSGGTIYGLPEGHVWVEFRETLSLEHAEQIELEENIRRKQLTMVEEQNAIAKLHKYRQKEDPSWSADKTAELIGKSRRTVYNAIELSDGFREHPDIAKADTASGAMLRLKRIKDLKKREDDIRVAALGKALGMEQRVQAEIIHGDALEGMRSLPDASVDGVIFNPPFGVDIESLFTSDKKIYSDNVDEMADLTEKIVEQAARVLKPDRWMVMFYPTVRLEDVKGIGPAMWNRIESIAKRHGVVGGLLEELETVCGGMLRRFGFSFQQVPAVWVKPNKRVSALGDPYAQLNINYETFYFARKGKAHLHKIPPSTTFVCDTPGTDRIHPLEMPVDLWTEILSAICLGGENVVEPFAGSGSGGEAAIQLGINYKGWELDGEFALHAQTRLVGALAGILSKPRNVPSFVETNGLVTIDTSKLDQNLFED